MSYHAQKSYKAHYYNSEEKQLFRQILISMEKS